MKRREVLGVIGGAAAWPLGVWAQQPKNVPRIGFLVTGSIESPETRASLKAFDQVYRWSERARRGPSGGLEGRAVSGSGE